MDIVQDKDIANELDVILKEFEATSESVIQLRDFDSLVLSFASKSLGSVINQYKGYISLPAIQKIELVKDSLERMDQSGSLTSQYTSMYNQCIVLATSYFTSTLRELFACYLNFALFSDSFKTLGNQELKVTLSDVRGLIAHNDGSLGEFFLNRKDVSFQDLQSVYRLAKDFFGFEIPYNANVKKLVVILACRHNIVHANGKVDERMIRQTRDSLAVSFNPFF